MCGLRSRASALHPSAYFKPVCQVHVVVDVGDFLCVGPWAESESPYGLLKNVYDLKTTMVRGGGQALGGGRVSEECVSSGSDAKHLENLKAEYGMQRWST